MPRRDKSKYTGKQERKADHIAEGYEASGMSHKESERRAWATVNKESGGGKKSGLGPRQEGKSRLGAQGRPDRRTRCSVTSCQLTTPLPGSTFP